MAGFIFQCSSVEQYWDIFVKQRNTVTTVVELVEISQSHWKAEHSSKPGTAGGGNHALSFLCSQRLQRDGIRSPLLFPCCDMCRACQL